MPHHLKKILDRAKKREELGISRNARLLASAGELNSNKNHSSIVRALAKIEDRSIHYINIVVFENDYHYVVDSVTLRENSVGEIELIR